MLRQAVPEGLGDWRWLGNGLHRQSPRINNATCSLMMPPLPVTNAVSHSAYLRVAGSAHDLARAVDDVVHAAGHAGLPEGQLAARRC